MRVFITGATGYLGSAVVAECLDVGHEVVGLARSDSSAAALEAAGAGVQRGALDDLDSLQAAARAADGMIHTAFIHDFSDFAAAARTDLLAVEALGTALEGTGRPLVIASGVAGVLTPGRLATEADPADLAAGPRAATEEALVAMSGRGVRSVAVRLPPTVHGAGDHGFLPTLIGVARERGTSAFIGDGRNRWPAVHRLDAAHLFRLALEDAPAGSRLHATAQEGVSFREIAEVIGRHLDVPVLGVDAEDAARHFGWISSVAGLDNPTSSTATRRALGWEPTQPDLLTDLEAGHYFSRAPADLPRMKP